MQRFGGKMEMAAKPAAVPLQGQLWLEPATPLASLRPTTTYSMPPPTKHTRAHHHHTHTQLAHKPRPLRGPEYYRVIELAVGVQPEMPG
jgi:hypothetical protein